GRGPHRVARALLSRGGAHDRLVEPFGFMTRADESLADADGSPRPTEPGFLGAPVHLVARAVERCVEGLPSPAGTGEGADCRWPPKSVESEPEFGLLDP